MSLISTFMVAPRLHQHDGVAVRTSLEETWRAVRAFDVNEVALMRCLVALRTAPERAVARLRGSPRPLRPRSRIEDITAPGSGFVLLGEAPGREVVVGAVGRFWQPRIAWREVAPADFSAFAEPGWGKVAWNLHVSPMDGGGSWVSCDLRVTGTDDASWRRFVRYFRVVGPFSHLIRKLALQRLRARLGAADRRTPRGYVTRESSPVRASHH